MERAFWRGLETALRTAWGFRRQRDPTTEDPPSRAGILQALKEMKNNKSAGIDRIPAEILKLTLTSPQILCCLFSPTFGHPRPSRTSGKEELSWRYPRKATCPTAKIGGAPTFSVSTAKYFVRSSWPESLRFRKKELKKASPGRSWVDQINTLRMNQGNS